MFEQYESIYFKFVNVKNKIAAFDLDYTLIKPKSKKKFPKDKDDWEFLFDKVKSYFKTLVDNDYSIIIFTNQKGISKGKLTIEEFYDKILQIEEALELELNIIISTNDDRFRKPMTGMWDFFLKKNDIDIDYENSFYVGDAAGRIYNKRKDHSSDDLYFAFNIKLKFFTPEKFFDEPDENHEINEFNLKSYNDESIDFDINHNNKNIIIMVGAPASGKSFISKKFDSYKIISQDKLKSKKKCLEKTLKYLSKNRNIIIDNTNPTSVTRKEYIDLANKFDYNKIIIDYDIPKSVVKYLNKYRTQTENVKLIPDIVYNIFYKKYEKPLSDEGKIIVYKNYFINQNYKF